MTTGKLLATAGILLALVSLSFLPAAAQSYTVTDLGTLGGVTSAAGAINNVGQVVGYAENQRKQNHAFLWSSDTGMVDLGLLHTGDIESFSRAINDSGTVVGISGSYAFLWTQDSGMQDLGNLGGGYADASGINNLGQVLGFS